MSYISIIVVDDHQIVRDGIKAMFFTSKIIKVVAEAADYDEFMNVLAEKIPDVILLDIALPGKSGVEIVHELKSKKYNVKILMLSSSTDEQNIVNSIQAGANGFLPKDTSKEELIEAITVINNNEEYFGAKLSKIIYNSYTRFVKSNQGDNASLDLSERELNTIKFLADGLSSKEIADKLFISPRTVESHKSNILSKLNLNNNADIIKYAIKHGIVKL